MDRIYVDINLDSVINQKNDFALNDGDFIEVFQY